MLLFQEEEKDYKGPTPGELLEPLFKQSSCSYRVCYFCIDNLNGNQKFTIQSISRFSVVNCSHKLCLRL